MAMPVGKLKLTLFLTAHPICVLGSHLPVLINAILADADHHMHPFITNTVHGANKG